MNSKSQTAGSKISLADLEKKFHGSLGVGKGWDLPALVLECCKEARPGYDSMASHEFQESPKVLQEKVALLAKLLKTSKQPIVYTGAGISTASGIDDYATNKQKSSLKGKRILSAMDAQPTLSHFILVQLYQLGLLKHWFQQNHDGLPQKAGMPQQGINEIHGSWYDPSNPVIPMSGNLRSDLFASLLKWKKKTDLCLTLGTSLCGMTSDSLAIATMKRAQVDPSVLGAVVVNLQQTTHDNMCQLRIFAKIDEVMKLLAKELGLTKVAQNSGSKSDQELASSIFTPYNISVPAANLVEEDVFLLPYNSFGILNHQEGEAPTVLDLREGAEVRMNGGPYSGDLGVVDGKNLEGHYKIIFKHSLKKKSKLKVPFSRVLGLWWVEAAAKGSVPQLPISSVVCEP